MTGALAPAVAVRFAAVAVREPALAVWFAGVAVREPALAVWFAGVARAGLRCGRALRTDGS